MELVPAALLFLRAFFFASIGNDQALPIAVNEMRIEIDLVKHRMDVQVPVITLLTNDEAEKEATISILRQNLKNGPIAAAPKSLGLVLKKCKVKQKKGIYSAQMRVYFADNSKFLAMMGITPRGKSYRIYPESGEAVEDGNGMFLGEDGEGYSWPIDKPVLKMSYKFPAL